MEFIVWNSIIVYTINHRIQPLFEATERNNERGLRSLTLIIAKGPWLPSVMVIHDWMMQGYPWDTSISCHSLIFIFLGGGFSTLVGVNPYP